MPLRCCVNNCSAYDQTLHRFPNPDVDLSRFFRWLELLGLKNFHMKTPLQIYHNERICFAHFESSYKNLRQHTLNRYAIPTIGIPDANSEVSSSTSRCTKMSRAEPTESQN